jgi:transposase InsO family protein
MGWRVSENTVAALMAEWRLRARARRRPGSTTRPGKGRWCAPDLVGQDFSARGVNQRWFGDGTEIDTAEGTLQLASVLDVCSRRIVGFALSEHHDAELAYGSLAMAVAVRGGHVVGWCCIPTAAASTPRGCSARPAPGWGSTSRWAERDQRWNNAVIESWHSTLVLLVGRSPGLLEASAGPGR